MRDKVIEWLRMGANAQEGVRLMENAGAPLLTLRLIRANPTANVRLMADYLRRKYNVCPEEKKQLPAISFPAANPFRREFPFLGKPGCPVELEALASRKISKYHAYVALHSNLRDCTSLQECADVAGELIDNFIENRIIWDELNYYQEHHSLLGKHPIFIEFQRRNNLLHMPIKDLVLRQQQVQQNMWRVKSELAKGTKPHLDGVRKERLAGYEQELNDINRLLG